MLFIRNIQQGPMIGTGGRVGRVMSGRISAGGYPGKDVVRVRERCGQGFVGMHDERGQTMTRSASLTRGCQGTDCERFIELWSSGQRWRAATCRYM